MFYGIKQGHRFNLLLSVKIIKYYFDHSTRRMNLNQTESYKKRLPFLTTLNPFCNLPMFKISSIRFVTYFSSIYLVGVPCTEKDINQLKLSLLCNFSGKYRERTVYSDKTPYSLSSILFVYLQMSPMAEFMKRDSTLVNKILSSFNLIKDQIPYSAYIFNNESRNFILSVSCKMKTTDR